MQPREKYYCLEWLMWFSLGLVLLCNLMLITLAQKDNSLSKIGMNWSIMVIPTNKNPCIERNRRLIIIFSRQCACIHTWANSCSPMTWWHASWGKRTVNRKGDEKLNIKLLLTTALVGKSLICTRAPPKIGPTNSLCLPRPGETKWLRLPGFIHICLDTLLTLMMLKR